MSTTLDIRLHLLVHPTVILFAIDPPFFSEVDLSDYLCHLEPLCLSLDVSDDLLPQFNTIGVESGGYWDRRTSKKF